MKHLLTAIFLISLSASQTFALSCMPNQIENAYLQHSQAKESYILVSGILTNKRNAILGPLTQGVGARSENFTATFVGHQANRAGFDRPFKVSVAVSAECGGPWCGSVTVDTPMMTFLEITPYGHDLVVGPCGGNVFYNPTKDQIERALQCLRGGQCEPKIR